MAALCLGAVEPGGVFVDDGDGEDVWCFGCVGGHKTAEEGGVGEGFAGRGEG